MKLSPLYADYSGDFFGALRGIVHGTADTAYLPLPATPSATSNRLAQAMGLGEDIEDDTAIVATTSGSTGHPKGAMLSRDNLMSSISATQTHFQDQGHAPGAWNLLLSAEHIAGIQVILRSLHAGFMPEFSGLNSSFSHQVFKDSTHALMEHHPVQEYYTSLVPTQLYRLLDQPDSDTLGALCQYSGILIGGAGLQPALRERAKDYGIRIVTTYGSSETSGGMVYDGYVLQGGSFSLTQDNHIVLAGAQVSRGYRRTQNSQLSPTDEAAFGADHTFTTSDYGKIVDGKLHVLGRADSIINSGGLKILPHDVERALTSLPTVARSVAFELTDPHWGHTVAAAIETPDGDQRKDFEKLSDAELASLRDALVRGGTEAWLIPKTIWSTTALPEVGSLSKLDRQRIIDILTNGNS